MISDNDLTEQYKPFGADEAAQVALLHGALEQICDRENRIAPWAETANAAFWNPMAARLLAAALITTHVNCEGAALREVYELFAKPRQEVLREIAVLSKRDVFTHKPLFQTIIGVVAQELRASEPRHRDWIFFEAVSLLDRLRERYGAWAPIRAWAMGDKHPSGVASSGIAGIYRLDHDQTRHDYPDVATQREREN